MKNIHKAHRHFPTAPAGAVLAILLLLSSCGSGYSDSAKADAAPGAMDYGYSYYADMNPMEAEYYAETTAAATMSSKPSSSQTSSSNSNNARQQDSARKLIKNVSLSLETLEFDTFTQQLSDRIAAAGGYIENSSVDGGSYYSYRKYSRSASVTARIPAEYLEDFLNDISSISNIISRTENSRDVTLSYYDMESHVKALRSEYDTLLGILEKCTEVKDVISVQSRITEVLYQIESYQTQLNNYDNLVAYSTVSMTITEVEKETPTTDPTLGERISRGWGNTMEDISRDAQNFAVSFVANLPYIVIWAVVIVALILIIRALIRRQKKKKAQKKDIANDPK